MSRAAHRAWAFGATGALINLITVPGAHKFEIVDWSCSGSANAGTGYLLMNDAVASATFFLDQMVLAAGIWVDHHEWGCGVVEAGNTIQVLWIGGAGTGGVHQLSYIDVLL